MSNLIQLTGRLQIALSKLQGNAGKTEDLICNVCPSRDGNESATGVTELKEEPKSQFDILEDIITSIEYCCDRQHSQIYHLQTMFGLNNTVIEDSKISRSPLKH